MLALDIEEDISEQAKLYDKIIKENMRKVLPGIIKDVLGIKIVSSEDLPESLQHTKETVPDQFAQKISAIGKAVCHFSGPPQIDHALSDR